MTEFFDFDIIDESGSQAYAGEISVPMEDLNRDEVAANVRVKLDVEASKGGSDGEYEVRGRFEAESSVICGRCLEPVEFAESSDFAVRYRPRATEPGGVDEDIEIDDGGLDVSYYDERRLPVIEVVVEQVQLSIPMKVLCREDCRGLCPECGTNLNMEDCSCERTVKDDRWQDLEAIREKLAKQENEG